MSRFGELSARVHYELVSSIAAPDAAVLDVGCGSGERLYWYLPGGPARVIGLEKLFSEASVARQWIPVIVGDLAKTWSVASGAIDVVSANQVIEHMTEPDMLATEAFRVLRPGGWAVVSTENLAAWCNIGALLLGQEPFSTNFSKSYFGVGNRFSRRRLQPITDVPHYSVPSLAALRHLFELTGFSYRDAVGVHRVPAPQWIVRRLTRVDRLHSLYITLLFQKPQ